ncbi:hypothetical protein G6F62_005933 [Rhizopus arrhizus]|nr:hypothetical protein G6F23_001739 [Rhizopus arrhizus]KAG0763888.1 hypothetical protein G6F24_005658 [Rhizopus arrhizus]KAG0942655.1 hypothetical protein G6F32_007962 [Rhizopus arrhizus]KAG1294327.1 hypothetical protein G6F66_005310 [Rhizopus arrhizus]KAG1337342.1 hypothetical protein G6F62_005933 [Rhizopus arrhizus]
MNAAQTVAAIYKGAERLRTTARSATRIDGDLKCIIEEGLRQILKKVAKEHTTYALRLPSSFGYLEEEKGLEIDMNKTAEALFFFSWDKAVEEDNDDHQQTPTKPANRAMTTAY